MTAPRPFPAHNAVARSLLNSLKLAALAACITPPLGVVAQPVQLVAPAPYPALVQPPNVGDAKLAATAYHDSGAYARDLASVASDAGTWIAERAPQVNRPALVLDIDDTALTNWEVIKADDFGRIINGRCTALPEGPCGWAAWDLLGRAPVIQSTLRLVRQARALNVAVFFITGRPESQRAATEQNLRNVGYDGYAALRMVPEGAHYASAAAFKAPGRAAIEAEGYTIIANVGDQPSDLAGGHAERTFLLPNPFYRIP
jgi:predicted secreted acid phosphatase